MNPIDSRNRARLYWAGVILYFALFSFNAWATSVMDALVGVKWDAITGQERFLIVVAILANWTGLVLVFVQKGMARLASGKAPIATGDTEHIPR